jgi:hypothetical protein
MESTSNSKPQPDAAPDDGQPFEVECIPGTDDIRRHIFHPQMYRPGGNGPVGLEIVGEFIFSEQNGRRESVVWSKYCATPRETHELGFAKAARDLAQKMAGYRRSSSEYVGFIESDAAKIRSVAPALFDVLHVPAESRPHAEIEMSADVTQIVSDNLDAEERAAIQRDQLSAKQARMIAIAKLRRVFSPLVQPT